MNKSVAWRHIIFGSLITYVSCRMSTITLVSSILVLPGKNVDQRRPFQTMQDNKHTDF